MLAPALAARSLLLFVPAPAAPPRAAIVSSAQPYGIGDGVICADDYGTWWVATVLEVAGDRVKVHYDGCDVAWDEWVALARVQPRPPGQVAAQAEDLEGLDDEEALERLRGERQARVDQWMFNTLAASHAGTWRGRCDVYRADSEAAVPALVESFDVASTTAVAPEGREVRLTTPTRDLVLRPDMLRAKFGNMAVGGGFVVTHEQSQALVFELGLAHEAARVRCTVGYSGWADGDTRSLDFVEVAREGRDGQEPPAGPAGTGVYDPEALAGAQGLFSLYCDGGITVVLPLVLHRGVASAVSLDWHGRELRLQADRKAGGDHDGSLLTLEVTEAQGADGGGK